jgi:hypothetical protein
MDRENIKRLYVGTYECDQPLLRVFDTALDKCQRPLGFVIVFRESGINIKLLCVEQSRAAGRIDETDSVA